ncbi:MAG TPA: hypothetical protein VIK62_07155, partial [Verrucomicrobiae bacterium]
MIFVGGNKKPGPSFNSTPAWETKVSLLRINKPEEGGTTGLGRISHQAVGNEPKVLSGHIVNIGIIIAAKRDPVRRT